MKPAHRRFAAALLRLFLALLFALSALSPAPALAQDGAPEPPPSFLIALRVPNDTPFEQIPAGLDPFQSAVKAAEIIYQDAGPLVQALRAMQATGQIERFEYEPQTAAIQFHSINAFVIRVYGSREPFEAAYHEGTLSPEAAAQIAAVLSEGEPAPECTANAARAFHERVKIYSQTSVEAVYPESHLPAMDSLSGEEPAPDAAVAAPVVNIYMPTGSDLTSVSGTVAPNSSVSLQILRAGNVIVSELQVSTASGSFFFSPRYLDCSNDEYAWKIQDDDEIRVSSAGLTSTVQANTITAWIDPDKKVAAGKTTPGSQVVAEVSYLDAARCTEIKLTQSGNADANGDFSIPLIGIDRTGFGQVHVRDANGNGSFTYAHAYQVYIMDGWISGSARPNQTYSIIHSRGSAVIYQQTITTRFDGMFDFSTGGILQANDVIEVSQNGAIYTRYIYAAVTATLDIANNKLTGKTASNHRLTALFTDAASCQSEKCLSAAPASDGSFTILPGIDLWHDDSVGIYSYDPAGNVQSVFIRDSTKVYLSANLNNSEIEGNWFTDEGNPWLEIKNSSGVIKESGWLYLGGSSHISFYFEGLAPGDVIKVTDTITMTSYSMVVANVTARLRNGTNVLSGTASAGKLIASMYNPPNSERVCKESAVNGNYTLTYSGAAFIGGTSASIVHFDTQGNHTHIRNPYAFMVNYKKGQNLAVPESNYQVWGYVDTSGAKVSLTHKRAGSVIGTYTGIDSNTGSEFHLNLSVGKFLEEGDVFSVTTTDGSSAQITVPALEAALTSSSQVTGRAPASSITQGWLYNYAKSYTGVSQSFKAIASEAGDFTAGLGQSFWCAQTLQYPVSVESGCNRIRLVSKNAQGHSAYWSSPMPTPATADTYEPDNTPEIAVPYTGQMVRTFHDNMDVDYISFEIAEAGEPVIFSFKGLGDNMKLYANLRSEIGDTLVMKEISANETQMLFTPSLAGKYYLQLSPLEGNYGKCSSRYVFTTNLDTYSVYLPSLIR